METALVDTCFVSRQARFTRKLQRIRMHEVPSSSCDRGDRLFDDFARDLRGRQRDPADLAQAGWSVRVTGLRWRAELSLEDRAIGPDELSNLAPTRRAAVAAVAVDGAPRAHVTGMIWPTYQTVAMTLHTEAWRNCVSETGSLCVRERCRRRCCWLVCGSTCCCRCSSAGFSHRG